MRIPSARSYPFSSFLFDERAWIFLRRKRLFCSLQLRDTLLLFLFLFQRVNSTYFLTKADARVTLVVIFTNKKVEKDSYVTAFMHGMSITVAFFYRLVFVYIFPFISICVPVSNKITRTKALSGA